MDKEKNTEAVSEENIYCLNGRVPVKKAIPFGLQHVLAMFVSNLAPVLIVCSAAFVRGSENHLSAAEITQLLQCAMFAAGIGTCLQLYPVWKIGSRLPIVMGVSFTFLGSLLMICTNSELGYEGMVGAVIAGGIFEGLVGMSAKYWKRFLTPVVSACVVIAIGLSLLSVGMDSWGGGSGVKDFGSWYHLVVGAFTLIVCLVSREVLKGVYKNLNVLVGLVFGYALAIIFTVAGIAPMVDFSGIHKTIQEVGVFSIPKLVFLTSANLPVAPFVNGDTKKRCLALLSEFLHLCGARWPAVNFDGTCDRGFAARYVLAEPDEVDLVHLFFGVRQPVCKFSVVCQKQEPFRIKVQPPDRIHPRAAAGDELCNISAPLFIRQRADIPSRLVEHQNDARGLPFQAHAVDLDDVFLVVRHIAEACRVAVDAYAAVQNHLLGLPPGGYAVI